MEITYKKRTRVNFGVSVKGIVTPDVTVETFNDDTEDTLKEATELLDKALVIAKARSTEKQ